MPGSALLASDFNDHASVGLVACDAGGRAPVTTLGDREFTFSPSFGGDASGVFAAHGDVIAHRLGARRR